VRTDDLAATPITALKQRYQSVDWDAMDDVIYGCANQAGEDNRNVARMALLLAGLPESVPGATVNRLCGVMPKATTAFSRNNTVFDTTIGWRFVNPVMQRLYGTDSMPETAENVAVDYEVSRADQDAFALRSQQKAAAAQENGRLAQEIVAVHVPQRKGDPIVVERDEHPRATSLEALARLRGVVREDGTVTPGNASGVNDGSCALIIASEEAARKYDLKPMARFIGIATAGCAPRIMGIGPVPASQKLLARTGVKLDDIDVIELNEAFAAQGLAVLRELGIKDDDARVNPNGGAIALGHPLGMSGARLVTTAAHELRKRKGRYALTTMCIGVGQGIAALIERV
jgi:acetyl-CoA acetyltransferase family protein